MEVEHQAISSHAGIHDDCSRRGGQSPAKISAEGGEYYLEVRLKMGQPAAVFLRVHTERFSTGPDRFARRYVTVI